MLRIIFCSVWAQFEISNLLFFHKKITSARGPKISALSSVFWPGLKNKKSLRLRIYLCMSAHPAQQRIHISSYRSFLPFSFLSGRTRVSATAGGTLGPSGSPKSLSPTRARGALAPLQLHLRCRSISGHKRPNTQLPRVSGSPPSAAKGEWEAPGRWRACTSRCRGQRRRCGWRWTSFPTTLPTSSTSSRPSRHRFISGLSLLYVSLFRQSSY